MILDLQIAHHGREGRLILHWLVHFLHFLGAVEATAAASGATRGWRLPIQHCFLVNDKMSLKMVDSVLLECGHF